MTTLLNYKIEGSGSPIILIHGLFGSLDNLGLLARDLKENYQVVSLDLRNHGRSFHSEEHDYASMADDVYQLVSHLKLPPFALLGHSMGGKVAMKFAEKHSDLLDKLLILDIAPVIYTQRRHDNVFQGLQAVEDLKPQSRSEALSILAQHIHFDAVIAFLSKSLYRCENHEHGSGKIFCWRFNASLLESLYSQVIGWESISQVHTPTLFLKGKESDYVLPEHQDLILEQFSDAKAHVISNTGHWLHSEKPLEVLRAIRKFIER